MIPFRRNAKNLILQKCQSNMVPARVVRKKTHVNIFNTQKISLKLFKMQFKSFPPPVELLLNQGKIIIIYP